MVNKSFRIIDIASTLQTKKKAWMRDFGSNWPWHITFWDNSWDCMPKYLKAKDIFEGESQVKILSHLYTSWFMAFTFSRTGGQSDFCVTV